LEWDKIEALSMACPAMPLCGLAIGEAERSLPDFNARLRAVLDRLGFAADEKFVVRATGEHCCLTVPHCCCAVLRCCCAAHR
jgi:sulfite reductase (ferredoxin)